MIYYNHIQCELVRQEYQEVLIEGMSISEFNDLNKSIFFLFCKKLVHICRMLVSWCQDDVLFIKVKRKLFRKLLCVILNFQLMRYCK